MQIEYRPIEQLIPYIRNARTHSDEQVALIAASIKEFGWTNPILVDGANGVIAGHGRLRAARKLGMTDAPVIELAHMTEAQKRAYIIADNKLAERAGWDEELLKLELGELRDQGFDLSLTGFDGGELGALMDDEPATDKAHGSLAEKFVFPPFSVLNARDSAWQERKSGWLAMGLQSAAGRDADITYSASAQPPAAYQAKNEYDAKLGRKSSWEEFYTANPEAYRQPSVSIFDPVLCELLYRWFSPPGGLVVDPFAGGSVRGVVAARLGRQYIGIDVRSEQVEANRAQWEAIGKIDPAPVWHAGDSRGMDLILSDVAADFVFSCPPYADLEVYSDDPRDLSTMDYADFRAAYFEIIRKACALLKPDRFACFVVGEVRGPGGTYRDFVGDTVQAFQEAGLSYYNEAILVTSVGSLAIRVGKQFSTSRKLGKTHQNVLVFCKGDPRKATEACGVLEVDESFAVALDEGVAAGGL